MNTAVVIGVIVLAFIALGWRAERNQAKKFLDVYADVIGNMGNLYQDEIDEHAKTEGHLKGMVTTGNHVFGLIINNLQTLDKSTLTRIRKFRNALDSAETRI